MIGKRVAELYIDPLTAYFFICCLGEASDKRLSDFSFLQMISHTLEIRPLLRVGIKEYDKIQEQLVVQNNFLLEKEPSMYEPEYEDFINSIKTAMMFYDWINEKDEEFLLEEYNVRPGELRTKLDIADWLLYSSEELSKLLYFKSLIKEIVKLRLRLRYGVKEELLPLLKLEQIGRVRARTLYRNKIKDISDIKKVRLEILEQILGKKIAFAIKKQVGEEIKIVPERKRKGQISLKDY
jgi:helicase